MSFSCPVCQHVLTPTLNGAHCAHCQQDFTACCPDCRQPLQILQACGAKDCFCQHGHGLLSKQRLLWLPVA